LTQIKELWVANIQITRQFQHGYPEFWPNPVPSVVHELSQTVRPKLDPLKVQLVSRKPSFGPFSYEEQMNLDTKEFFRTHDLSNSYWLTNHKKHEFKKLSKAANFQSLQDKGFKSWHLIAPHIYVPYLVSHPLYFVYSS